MMKWKARTETTNIGILELGNLTFDEDYMEVSIDICDMSDSMKAEVDKAIEIAKVQYTKENETLNAENGYHLPTVWSDKPVVMDFTYLRVILEAGKPIHPKSRIIVPRNFLLLLYGCNLKSHLHAILRCKSAISSNHTGEFLMVCFLLFGINIIWC